VEKVQKEPSSLIVDGFWKGSMGESWKEITQTEEKRQKRKYLRLFGLNKF